MVSFSENPLYSNIVKLYFIKISHWLMLTMPIILIFYNANHLSVRHLFIIQAVYSLTILGFEIPSGMLADIWGRKRTLVIGALFGFLGYSIYSFSSGFFGFLLAEIILGIGQSCISGTDTAMLYDTMLAMNKQEKYLKIEGQMTSVGNFAEALAGIAGGLLAVISPRFPFMCQAVIALIAIPAALMLVEPKLHSSFKKPDVKDIISTFRNTLFGRKELLQNIMLSSVIGASTLTMAWFVQPFFKNISIPVAVYGILWTCLNATVGFSALLAYKIERKLGETKVVTLIVIVTTLTYITLYFSQSFWMLGVILVFYIIRGIATPILKDYINKLISSETRASVLSLRNLIIRGIFSTLAPIIGYLADKVSLQIAFLMAGLTFFIFSLPFLIMYWLPSKEN